MTAQRTHPDRDGADAPDDHEDLATYSADGKLLFIVPDGDSSCLLAAEHLPARAAVWIEANTGWNKYVMKLAHGVIACPARSDGPEDRGSVREELTEEAGDLLRRLRAEQELLGRQRARAIVHAADDGHTQRWIAKALGTSQSDIHRTLRTARAAASETSPDSPREMALRLITGTIDRSTLIDRMATAAEGTSSPYDGDDGYRRGPWDEFRLAWMDGLVDDDVYEEVLARRAASWTDDSCRD